MEREREEEDTRVLHGQEMGPLAEMERELTLTRSPVVDFFAGENKAKKVAEVPPPPPPPPWYRRWMLLVSSLPPRLLDSLRSLSVRRSVSNYGTALHQPTRQAPWWNVWRRLTGPSTPEPEPTQRANSLVRVVH